MKFPFWGFCLFSGANLLLVSGRLIQNEMIFSLSQFIKTDHPFFVVSSKHLPVRNCFFWGGRFNLASGSIAENQQTNATTVGIYARHEQIRHEKTVVLGKIGGKCRKKPVKRHRFFSLQCLDEVVTFVVKGMSQK